MTDDESTREIVKAVASMVVATFKDGGYRPSAMELEPSEGTENGVLVVMIAAELVPVSGIGDAVTIAGTVRFVEADRSIRSHFVTGDILAN
jgi:hypothetical protein